MTEGSGVQTAHTKEELIGFLSEEHNEGRPVESYLRAHNRVIARVTDGIYRMPGSALRELIANAWDADAQTVVIDTDAPRFARITIRDDGEGMSYETLARLIHSIGGSAKRQDEGQELGISSDTDPERTPGGRLFIGKIGIGLFSVSQLTRSFTIITKLRGADYRLIARVVLRTHSEDHEDTDDGSDTFISGRVSIVRERAADPDAHGTDVVLDGVKPTARDLLRSADRWRALEEARSAIARGDLETARSIRATKPAYHMGWIEGRLDSPEAASFAVEPQLPWSKNDAPDERMARLVARVGEQFSRTERPDLATTLDSYLSMLWQVALSVPVPYVDRHPFDLRGTDQLRLFWASNEPRAQATEIPIGATESVREAVRRWSNGKEVLTDGTGAGGEPMKVVIDGVELRRPIQFRFIKTERRGLDSSILMVGRYSPHLDRVAKSIRGGRLTFEAYLFWNGRIIPKENNGVLVRIRGASGANFDETFFKYQVSEQTRMKQIMSEIYVQEGLDAALNIDRESFNFAHPHVHLTSSWLHGAIRQLTNRHKDLSQKSLAGRRTEQATETKTLLDAAADHIWRSNRGDEPPPDLRIDPDDVSAMASRNEGYISLSRSRLPAIQSADAFTARQRQERAIALAKVLLAFGVLEGRSYEEQEKLLDAILSVFYVGEAR